VQALVVLTAKVQAVGRLRMNALSTAIAGTDKPDAAEIGAEISYQAVGNGGELGFQWSGFEQRVLEAVDSVELPVRGCKGCLCLYELVEPLLQFRIIALA
jgi:hypothetical protein